MVLNCPYYSTAISSSQHTSVIKNVIYIIISVATFENTSLYSSTQYEVSAYGTADI